jgi:hypothetical protein
VTVIAALIALSIGAPIAEIFDSWDQTLQDGNDTEANPGDRRPLHRRRICD